MRLEIGSGMQGTGDWWKFCWQNLPSGKRVRSPVLAVKIEQVDRVTGGVTGNGDMARSADVKVVLRQLDGFLKLLRGFDKGRNEARGHVPFKMAVKYPDS